MMNIDKSVDSFLRRHPRIFLLLVVLLTAIAGAVLLGGLRDVGLVYKAF
jgi:hypothetical protein